MKLLVCLLGGRYVHPDDPINHLDAIAAGLFDKHIACKQDGNVTARRGNATSPTEEPRRGSSQGCHDDSHYTVEGEQRAVKRLPEERYVEASHGLRAGCTLTSRGDRWSRDSALKDGETAPQTSRTRNLSNTLHDAASPEDAAEQEISDCAAGGWGAGEEPLAVPGVRGECSRVGSEDNEPRRLASTVKPLSREDLLKQRLSTEDICKMDRFSNYIPGQPSKVAKTRQTK